MFDEIQSIREENASTLNGIRLLSKIKVSQYKY